MKECRVVLMGCGGVGKSALAIRFATGEFVPSYDPTIEDFYRHPVTVEGLGVVSLEILDTAGTGQHYNNNRHLYITSGHVFALIYSVDSRDSLDSLHDLYRDIVRVKRSASAAPIIIVGTKCDVDGGNRQVAVDDVRRTMRKSWGVSRRNVPVVIETSAKEGKNVDTLFQHVARLSMVAMVRTLPRGARAATLDVKRQRRQSLGSAGTGVVVVDAGGTPTRNSLISVAGSRDSTMMSLTIGRKMARPKRSAWHKRMCVIL